MCPAKSVLRVQHELHMELICKHSHQPPALDGQNGPPPVRLLCWIPFEAQSRSDLLWAAPRWTHVDSPWILWVPAEVHPCLQIGPIEKTKIDLALKTVNIKSGFFKHKTAKTNDQIRDFVVVMKQEKMRWENTSPCPMIIFFNLFLSSRHAVKNIFSFSGSSSCPRGLWSHDQRKAKKLWRFFLAVA